MSNRTSISIQQLEAKVPGSIESLLKELLVVCWLVRASSTEFVEQRLTVEGIGRLFLAAQLVPHGGFACRGFRPDRDLRRVV